MRIRCVTLLGAPYLLVMVGLRVLVACR